MRDGNTYRAARREAVKAAVREARKNGEEAHLRFAWPYNTFLAKSAKQRYAPNVGRVGKYEPHQGKAEIARRIRQEARNG
ncbi:MAG: hypothetical protein ACOVN5_07025 [Aquidulcibacter sp.]